MSGYSVENMKFSASKGINPQVLIIDYAHAVIKNLAVPCLTTGN